MLDKIIDIMTSRWFSFSLGVLMSAFALLSFMFGNYLAGAIQSILAAINFYIFSSRRLH